jgi:hypothetical protein
MRGVRHVDRAIFQGGGFRSRGDFGNGCCVDDVCKALDAAGRSDVTKDAIAAKIIDLARAGESDSVVLYEMALSEFGLSDLSEKR